MGGTTACPPPLKTLPGNNTLKCISHSPEGRPLATLSKESWEVYPVSTLAQLKIRGLISKEKGENRHWGHQQSLPQLPTG